MTSTTANIEAIYPLTPVQEGVLFHTLYAADSPLYFQQYTCLLEGTLDADSFKHAWQTAIDRHPALRSLFTWEGRQQPLQVVRSRAEAAWRMEDWRGRPEQDQVADLDDFLAADRQAGFALDRAPLMRFALLRVTDDAHRFVWSHHHIIVDGWSMGLVLDDVFQTYEGLVRGADTHLEDPPAYRDYVRWLKARDLGPAEAYWGATLRGFEAPTPLRLGDPSPGSQWAERHSEEVVQVDAEATARLAAFARSRGLTMNTVLRGAWALVLARYAGSDDVVFGATVAGRPPELEGSLDMVGMFINTIPVRVVVRPAAQLADWLREIQEQQVEAAPHESTPLVSIQAWSEIPKGQHLFETLLVFENVPNPGVGAGSLRASDVRYLQRSNYPLAILVMPGDELELIFLYDADRFEAPLIARMADQLVTVLQGMATDAAQRVADVPIFPAAELSEILIEWNATESDFPADQTVHELIAAAAGASPARLAVTSSGLAVTYDQLQARAGALATRLRQLGIGPNDRVGVHMERSVGTIVAIVGVLNAGAAYVPLDPGLPRARLEYLLSDTAAKALVTDVAAQERPGPLGGAMPVVRVDHGGELGADEGNAVAPPADRTGSPEDLAYVLHTSGSTGLPKGVAVTHRNLVNSTHARLSAYGAPVDTFLLLSPFIFDSSVAGLFSTLTQGGTLVLPAARMEQDVHHLADLIASHQVTHTLALPTLYGLLLELADPALLESLRLVMVAGEPCPPSLVRDHYDQLPHVQLVNEYGPTEATVWCTVHHVPPPPGQQPSFRERVPIGRPIANTQAFVLDEADRPAPVGVPGELHIGGVNLAQGYLDRPDLTAERFVHRAIPGRGQVRLYRTGDIARFLSDGTIDLLGRVDHQVKIRGQRIELGEIEAVLCEHQAVADSVAVVGEGADAAAPMLVAYVEPTGSVIPSTEELTAFAAARLPEAMVPSVVVAVDRLPRGATGKIDRGALPEPTAGVTPAPVSFVEPEGAAEQRFAEIWRDVLGIERIGAHDNFFELGGDSILSIRIIARAHQAGLAITPKQFFDHPTVAGLANVAATG